MAKVLKLTKGTSKINITLKDLVEEVDNKH